MAFFCLTHLGYQNYLREHSVLSKQDPKRGTRQFNFVAFPPLVDKNSPKRSTVPVDQVSSYGAGPQGSFEELTRLRTKHVRNPAPPYVVYSSPPTTCSEYGFWTKDSPIYAKMPWAYVPRKPMIFSEMTKFVEDMALTNKQFKLY